MKKLRRKIKLLGINYDANIFNSLRLVFSLILFFYLIFSIKYGYIIAPLIAIIFYLLSEYVVIDIPLRNKIINMEKEGIEYVSSLLLNLKNSKSIRVSIKNSSRVINSDLSKEFSQVINDTKIGLTLEESLNNLSERIPSIFLQNIILNLKESNKNGTKVIDSIERQLEAMEQHYEEIVVGRNKSIPIIMCLNTILFLSLMVAFLFYIIK